MRANLAAKMRHPDRLHVIANFVDVDAVRPGPSENSYRAEYGLSGKTVVMYAGNVGMSQSLDLIIDAARATADRDDIVYVINGGGSTLPDLEASAAGLPNVRFVPMQPIERLPEVLAAADVHVVPSKTYSIMAAGRPVLASVDEGSEVQRIVEAAGAGIAVRPDDPEAFVKALRTLVDDAGGRAAMGVAARAYVERTASARGVAEAYAELFAAIKRS